MFEEALALRPNYRRRPRLAQLRWMRSGRRGKPAARARRDARQGAAEIHLHLTRSVALEFMGELSAAFASAQAGSRGSPTMFSCWDRHRISAPNWRGRPCGRLCAARRGRGARPYRRCRSRYASAARLGSHPSRGVGRRAPLRPPSRSINMRSRWGDRLALLGDARYAALYDYAQLTYPRRSDTPLEELAADLRRCIAYSAHPFQQSVRGAGSCRSMQRSCPAFDPRALPALPRRRAAPPGPRRQRRRSVPLEEHRALAQAGAWSVPAFIGRLSHRSRPSTRLLSSAFMSPCRRDAAGGDARRWLRTGRRASRLNAPRAGFPRQARAGKLVLFPSYMCMASSHSKAIAPG